VLSSFSYADYIGYNYYNYQRNFNLKIRRLEAKKIKKIGKIYGVDYYKKYSYTPVDTTYYDRQLQLNGIILTK